MLLKYVEGDIDQYEWTVIYIYICFIQKPRFFSERHWLRPYGTVVRMYLLLYIILYIFPSLNVLD